MAKDKTFFPFRRIAIVIICGLVIVFIINRVLDYLKGPAKGESSTVQTLEQPAQEDEKTRSLIAKYFSLIYSSKLDTVSDISGNDKTALEVYRLASREPTSRRTLTITIKTLPPDAFEGESSYLLRERNPQDYEKVELRIGETDYVLFEKSDDSEVTAFHRRGDKMAILAYTVSSIGVPPRTELQELLTGFSWR